MTQTILKNENSSWFTLEKINFAYYTSVLVTTN